MLNGRRIEKYEEKMRNIKVYDIIFLKCRQDIATIFTAKCDGINHIKFIKQTSYDMNH